MNGRVSPTMNDQNRRRGLRRLAAIAAAAAGIGLLAAACNGSPSAERSGGAPAPGGSASRPPGSSGSSAAGRLPSGTQQLAYSQCMRAHGVPGVPTSLPRPVLGKPPSKLTAKPAPANGPGPGSAQWQAAQQACRSLVPTPAMVPG